MFSLKIARHSKDIKRLNELLYRIESADTAEQEEVENVSLPTNDSLTERLLSEMRGFGFCVSAQQNILSRDAASCSSLELHIEERLQTCSSSPSSPM